MEETKEKDSETVKIPIIYDAIREIDGIPMLRCTYYTVQTDEPLSNWSLDLENKTYPILLLNLEAIIIGAPQSLKMFRNPFDIDGMYELIEDNTDLFVDINDIWVPHSWFKYREYNPGSVFRLRRDLFTYCWRYRNDQISMHEFIENKSIINLKILAEEKQQSMLDYSEEESIAFQNWSSTQIQKSQEKYRENKNKLNKLR